MKCKYQKCLMCLLFLIIPHLLFAFERRKPQFLTEPSYLILPMPYSLPGIGSGLMFTGLAANIFETNIDLFALAIGGDAEGTFSGIEDIHIINETLILDVQYQALRKAIVKNYEQRGMNTDKDDFQYMELSKVNGLRYRLMLSLFDRRLEIFYAYREQDVEIPRIRNSDGDLIAAFTDPYTSEEESRSSGFILDYTDDRQDPRKGIRLSMNSTQSPRKKETDPNYYVINTSAGAYIPIGDSSTWAFHYFTSDAVVTDEGETDYDKVKSDIDLNCSTTDLKCLAVEANLINNFIAANKYGTADSLGGDEKMRAYPQSRYQGAHTYYFSSEIRWNFIEELTPFDFWIWKDVATGFQLALFYEEGSVADSKEDLKDIIKKSTGIGIRMVSASGFVYRGDFATGDEGNATTIIFGYPW